MCKHIFRIKMHVQAHFLIKSKNKVVVGLHNTIYIERCSGNNMELYFYVVIQTYLLFRNCGGCGFEEPCVKIEIKLFFKKQKGYVRKIVIQKSWIIPFCCLCSQVCIHKSALIFHFNTKKENIKSRAPFSRFSKLCKSRAPVPKRLPEHTK